MQVRMQNRSFLGPLVLALTFATLGTPGVVQGQEAPDSQAAATSQTPALPQIDQAKLQAYAQAYLAIGAARSEIQDLMAESGNKTPEALAQLRERIREEVAAIVQEHGMTVAEYEQITFIVSADQAQRTAFNQLLATLEGGPQ